MKTRVDASFREEAERFRLRYACEACAHFDEIGESCSNGFPNSAHRGLPLVEQSELEFCKQFELG